MRSTLDLRATRKGIPGEERNSVNIDLCCCVIYLCNKG